MGIILAEKENKEIKKAIRALDFISADPKERERHNSILMAEINRRTSEHNFLKPEKKNGIQKGRYERKKRTEKLKVLRKKVLK